MGIGWAHIGTAVTASFLASLVECVEALTVVLAVAHPRLALGLTGSAAAIAVLLLIIAALGNALTHIPLHLLQLTVGTLLLLFGLRWLRKAILRAAGRIPLHDEAAAFSKNTEAMRQHGNLTAAWDKIAFAAAFNITMLEGTEVVFIVIAIGAGRAGTLLPASLGAVAALLVVIALGLILHRPLARVPENTLKFIVGILLSAFGTFWVGEGIDLNWPAADWSILALIAAYLLLAVATVPLCRNRTQTVPSTPKETSINSIKTILREIFGLFVDDASFALAILVWLLLVRIVSPHLGAASAWSGPILFFGLALILLESATRYSRRTLK